MIPVTIFNLSGIYECQDIYNCPGFPVIDCKNIEGTNGYCDEEAKAKLKKRINTCPLNGINFIDAGNFHYMSKFTTDRIEEDFTLVVFDHHSDMKESSFFGMLSCGSWILEVAKTNPHLKRIVLLGISKEQKELIPETDIELISFLDEDIKRKKKIDIKKDYPIYISIDKDVLDKSVLHTSWDQGIITEAELIACLDSILENAKLIGVDINGELEPHPGITDDDITNQEFNKRMINYFSDKIL
ncbi:MAG: arginase family protein [Lachnospiraceae bacterium]|nr:arginase family protein [Lachnospiraceae bacterium]